MKRGKIHQRKIFGIALAVLVISSICGALLGIVNLEPVSASPGIIYVPDDYAKIQWAVDNATSGDTIIVSDGTYTENIDVNKAHLTIRSENGAGSTIVQAATSNDDVFRVIANWVNITGFTVQNAAGSGFAGIYLYYAGHCNISSNNVTNNSNDGIKLWYSSDNTLTNNNASNNWYGIYLDESSSNTITNNNANSNDWYGIYLDSSSNNTLTNNTASSNYNDGIYLSSSSNNTLTNNTASNNNWGIYLDSSSNNTLTNNNATSNTFDGIYLRSSSNNNTLIDNTANSNRNGIFLDSSSNNTLTNNTANSNDSGIFLDSSSNNTLTNNNANSNDWCGIYLDESSSNTLTNNNASNNSNDGIKLWYSSDNTLTNNTMSGNTRNFFVNGNSLSRYTQNIDTSNTVDGKPIYYWVNHYDEQVPHDAGFVGIVNSTNITVRNLTLTKNSHGVLLAYTDNSSIEDVTASNNYYDGIYLDESSSSSSNNTLTNNTANSNDSDGICLDESSSNTITNNNANSNDWYGIYLMWFSSHNTIYLNNFVNNVFNAVSLSGTTNTWNSTEEITYTYKGSNHTGHLGNYWDDYTGSDIDGDGIGETPYTIDSDADSYPLVEPFENYEPPAPPPPPPVGGTIYPMNKLTILAPWIALAVLLAGSLTWLTLRRRRAHG